MTEQSDAEAPAGEEPVETSALPVEDAPPESARAWIARADSLAGTLWFRLALFSFLALLFAWPLVARSGLHNDFRDAETLFNFERSARIAVLEHGELPRWDPYYCGGSYALGSPQARFASPLFVLTLLFGPEGAVPLALFFFSLLGMEGIFRYARTYTAREDGGGSLGPLLVAPLFPLSGFFAQLLPMGWAQFFTFDLVPWVWFGVALLGRRPKIAIAIVASAFALMVGFAGTYTVPMAGIGAVFESLRLLAREGAFSKDGRARLPRLVGLLGLAAFASVALSAYRLWPVAHTLYVSPRLMLGSPSHAIDALPRFLLTEPQYIYGTAMGGTYYVGVALLVWAGLGISAGRRALFPLVLVLLYAALALGHVHELAPFSLLRHIPPFDSFRYPERYLILGNVLLTALAALASERVFRLRSARLALVGVVVFGLASAWTLGRDLQIVHTSVEAMVLSEFPPERDQPFAQARGNRWAIGQVTAANRGSLNCWDAYPVAMSPELRGDLPAEEYLVDPSLGSVTRRAWSPNRIDLEVELSAPGRLRVNQNWHAGWRASVGEVVSDARLLAVELPAGHHELTLRFVPRSALGGLLVSLVALVAFGFAWREDLSSRSLIVFVSLPPLSAALAFALVREPPPGRLAETNPDGTPALTEPPDALGPEARPLRARFAEPVRIVGAHVPADVRLGEEAAVEVDLVVDGPVPRETGVFVHFQRPDGSLVAADHHAVGGSFVLGDAPAGRTIRDVSAAIIDRPGEWRIFWGLWHVEGDGARVHVIEPAASDDRVELGRIRVR